MIATIYELKDSLGIITNDDDSLLNTKLIAAQEYTERKLGYAIETRYGGVDQDPVPQALKQAVLQLAGWWFEQREAGLIAVTAMEPPLGFNDIVREYRDYVF